MNRKELLEKISRLDFLATDLHLYLDTHPHDKDIIEKYNIIVNEANQFRRKYEENFGPLCSYRSPSDPNEWTWKDDPFPWSAEFAKNPCNCKEGVR